MVTVLTFGVTQPAFALGPTQNTAILEALKTYERKEAVLGGYAMYVIEPPDVNDRLVNGLDTIKMTRMLAVDGRFSEARQLLQEVSSNSLRDDIRSAQAKVEGVVFDFDLFSRYDNELHLVELAGPSKWESAGLDLEQALLDIIDVAPMSAVDETVKE